MESVKGNLSNEYEEITGSLYDGEELAIVSGKLSNDGLEVSGALASLGIRGYSAYEVAVKNGFTGNEQEWLESLRTAFDLRIENGIVYYKFKDRTTWYVLLDMTDLQRDVDSLLTNIDKKVDKKPGHSLMSDAEIERLSHVDNYDDADIRTSLGELKTNLEALSQGHTDDISAILKKFLSYRTSAQQDAIDKRIQDALALKLDAADLPKNVSSFVNDAGYATKIDVDKKADIGTSYTKAESDKKYLTQHQSLDGYAKESWVESKGYLTEHQSLDGYVKESWVESKGYLTEHQDISGKVDKETGKSLVLDSEIERLASLTNYNDSELRALITTVSNKLNALADSDDTTLDQLSEIVAFIKSNKNLIDAIEIPTKVSELLNDAGYLTETDAYTKTEVDAKLATAGKVKMVNNIPPDETGNIDLGDTMVGIANIEQTVTSEISGGVNVMTVTRTNGVVDRFEVRNGLRGATQGIAYDDQDEIFYEEDVDGVVERIDEVTSKVDSLNNKLSNIKGFISGISVDGSGDATFVAESYIGINIDNNGDLTL